jgi:ribosomal protein L6P/L9E
MKLPSDIKALKINDLLIIKGKLGIKKAYLDNIDLVNGEIITNDLATKRIIKKMIQGVTVGFKEKIKLVGVGYKALINQSLLLHLGFKNPISVPLDSMIDISIKGNGTIIEGKSSSHSKLSQYLSKIEQFKPSYKDIYKGKGVVRIK